MTYHSRDKSISGPQIERLAEIRDWLIHKVSKNEPLGWLPDDDARRRTIVYCYKNIVEFATRREASYIIGQRIKMCGDKWPQYYKFWFEKGTKKRAPK